MNDPLLHSRPLFDLAMNQKGLAIGQPFCHVRRHAIPNQSDAPSLVPECRRHDLTAPPWDVFRLDRHQLSDEALLCSHRCIAQLFYLPALFVAKRQMIEKILDRRQAKAFELRGPLGTYALKKTDRRSQGPQALSNSRVLRFFAKGVIAGTVLREVHLRGYANGGAP